MTKVYDNATDLITFARGSSGTALRRVGYGDELVTNGTFDTDTDWNAQTGWTISGGVVTKVAGVSNVVEQAGAVPTSGLVIVTFDATQTAGELFVRAGGNTNQGSISASGSYEFVLAVQGGDTKLRFVSDSSFAGTIDNISVKEVIFDRATDDLVLFNHPDDIPRIEYGSDGSLKGLLIEEQRTNFVTYSAPSTDGNLSTQRASLVTVAGVSAPDGSTAIKLQEDGTAAASHDMGTGNIMSASTTYTLSVFAKAAERDFVALNIYSGTTSYWTWFDLSAGTKGSVSNSPVATDIQSAGNGWYRCSLTVTTASSGTPNTRIYMSPSNGTLNYNGDGTSGIYIYGAQLEAGSFPTSYIPTSGSQSTRSPDIASIPVSAFGYNQTAGTVVVEVDNIKADTSQRVLSINNSANSVNDRIDLLNNANSENVMNYTLDGGSLQADHTVSVVGLTSFTVAAAFAPDDYSMCVNGGTVVAETDGTPTVPTVDTFRLGGGVSSPLNGHIKSLKYYPRRLTDAQLQELTA